MTLPEKLRPLLALVATVVLTLVGIAVVRSRTSSAPPAPPAIQHRFGVGTPAVQAVQGVTTLTGDNGTAQPGISTGQSVALSVVNQTCARVTWTFAVPTGSRATTTPFFTQLTTTATITPDLPGIYNVSAQCLGPADAGSLLIGTYLQTWGVKKVSPTVYQGPANYPPFAPNEVATPAYGINAFVDNTNGNLLSFKDTNGTLSTAVLAALPDGGISAGSTVVAETGSSLLSWVAPAAVELCRFSPSTSAIDVAIAAAVAYLPSTGGVVDARCIHGTYTAASTIAIAKPVKLLFDRVTIQSDGVADPLFAVTSNFEMLGHSQHSTVIAPKSSGIAIRMTGSWLNPTGGGSDPVFHIQRVGFHGGARAIDTTGLTGFFEGHFVIEDDHFFTTTDWAIVLDSSVYYSYLTRNFFEQCYGSAHVKDNTETIFRDNVHQISGTGAQSVWLEGPINVAMYFDRFWGIPPNVNADVRIEAVNDYAAGYVLFDNCRFGGEREYWMPSTRHRIETYSATGKGSVAITLRRNEFFGPILRTISDANRTSNVVTATLVTPAAAGSGLQIGDTIRAIQIPAGELDGQVTVTNVGSVVSGHQTITWASTGADRGGSGASCAVSADCASHVCLGGTTCAAASGFVGSLMTSAIKLGAPTGRWTIDDNVFQNYAYAVDDTAVVSENLRDNSARNIWTASNKIQGAVGIAAREFVSGGKQFSTVDVTEDSPLERLSPAARVSETPELRNRLPWSEDLTRWATLGSISVSCSQTDPFGGTRACQVTRGGTAPFITTLTMTEGLAASGMSAAGLRSHGYLSLWAKQGALSELSLALFGDHDSNGDASKIILFRNLTLGSEWKRYVLPVVWNIGTTILQLEMSPGTLDSVAGDVYVFGVQLSDYDSDYMPTSGAVVADTSSGTRIEKDVRLSAALVTEPHAGASPTVSSATGLGSGSASIEAGSNDIAGCVILSPSTVDGGAPAASGLLEIAWSRSLPGGHAPSIVASLVPGTGSWAQGATLIGIVPSGTLNVGFKWDWANGAGISLSNATTYKICYVVVAK